MYLVPVEKWRIMLGQPIEIPTTIAIKGLPPAVDVWIDNSPVVLAPIQAHGPPEIEALPGNHTLSFRMNGEEIRRGWVTIGHTDEI